MQRRRPIGVTILSALEILAGIAGLIYITPAGSIEPVTIFFMLIFVAILLTGILTFLLNKAGWYLQFTNIFTLPYLLLLFSGIILKRVVMIEVMFVSLAIICILMFFITRPKVKEQFEIKNKIASFIWGILLILIFMRAFNCDYAFLNFSLWYTLLLASFSIIYLFLCENKLSIPRPFHYFFILFLCAIIVSITKSKFIYWSISEIYMYIPNIFIFYVANKIDRKQQLQMLYWSICIPLILCVYALYQRLFGLENFIRYLHKMHMEKYLFTFISEKRPFTAFPSPNIFASYLILMFFLILGILETDFLKKRINTYFMIFSLIFIILSVVLTRSLGAIFSSIFILTFFIYFQMSKRNKIIFTPILVTVLAIILFFIRQRIFGAFNFRNPDNSLLQRWYYWLTSVKIIKEHFLFGVGWRNMGAVYDFYKIKLANLTHYSHNVFLQVMVETGILGFVAFTGMMLIFLKRGFQSIKRRDENQTLRLGVFCAGLVFLLHNMFDISFYFAQVSFFWWCILGFILKKEKIGEIWPT